MAFIAKTKEEMRDRCRKNIEDINQRCAYGGESFSKFKDAFEASKEYLRHGCFPSCYGDPDTMTTYDPSETIN